MDGVVLTLVLIVVGLVALDLAALRWGVDSRETEPNRIWW
jgi:hypothetical protein